MSTLSTIIAVVCSLTNIMWFCVFWSEHDDNNSSKRELRYAEIENSRLREENERLKNRKVKKEYVYLERNRPPCNQFHRVY